MPYVFRRDSWSFSGSYAAVMVRASSLQLLAAVFVLALVARLVVGPGESDSAATPPVASTSESTTGTTLPQTGDGATAGTEVSAISTSTADLGAFQGLSLELITTEVSRPVAIAAPSGDPRLFVADRIGVIRLVDLDTGRASNFLDLKDRVASNGIEQGLLGLAFHPDYSDNRRFFVYHVDSQGNRQVAEYQTSADDPDRGDVDSGRVLWERPQPSDETRHYGGMLQFGPDGYLWVSIGDGARASLNGQDPGNFYGTIQRLDVDSGDPYGIPADNPFVDSGGAPETWAFGLRNPWRFAIDPVERLVYVADVGQALLEEVDVVSIDSDGGANFGWPITEGSSCFNATSCDTAGITLPVIEYGHEDGCSITGGFVYRGSAIPEINGHYFYSDWCTGLMRSFIYADGVVTSQTDWTDQLPKAGQVNTFGLDGFGELYIGNHNNEIYKIVADR